MVWLEVAAINHSTAALHSTLLIAFQPGLPPPPPHELYECSLQSLCFPVAVLVEFAVSKRFLTDIFTMKLVSFMKFSDLRISEI